MDETTWAIIRPRSHGATVLEHTTIVIDDVPVGMTQRDVLDWLHVYDPQLDAAVRADEWSANVQLTASAAPRVRWTGRTS